MHNTFRVKNNHALYHALSYQKQTDLFMVSPLDKHLRTLDFFDRGIQNYKTVFKNIVNRVRLIDRVDIDKLYLEENTHIVMDMYYLKEERKLYEDVVKIARKFEASLDLVETNTIVPVTEVSNKEEYGARTIRPKIYRRIQEFIDPVLDDYSTLNGEKDALASLEDFATHKLYKYDDRNYPGKNVTSNLSGYLKYGFISPLTIYSRLEPLQNTESFIEELIVRRDLAYNFVFYNMKYYEFDSMTENWAYNTMNKHLSDQREYLYTLDDYIHFKTHDKYFNTAMKEMVHLGTMHGYMRMYWGKKIIEWSKTYKEAYNTLIYLNNYYFIDGNTPNGYTGIAWCFGKHDRAWKERDIFGKLRYMNSNGLERKFDMNEYMKRVRKDVLQNEKSV